MRSIDGRSSDTDFSPIIGMGVGILCFVVSFFGLGFTSVVTGLIKLDLFPVSHSSNWRAGLVWVIILELSLFAGWLSGRVTFKPLQKSPHPNQISSNN